MLPLGRLNVRPDDVVVVVVRFLPLCCGIQCSASSGCRHPTGKKQRVRARGFSPGLRLGPRHARELKPFW